MKFEPMSEGSDSVPSLMALLVEHKSFYCYFGYIGSASLKTSHPCGLSL
jgi:hypothetical protein